MIVLKTIEAKQGRFERRRRRRQPEAEPAAALVPTARVTIAHAGAFADRPAAERWVAELRSDESRLRTEVEDGVAVLNRVIRAHRAAAADPYAREVRTEQALVRRAGYGDGELIAAGAAVPGVDLPASTRRPRRTEMLAPHARLAAVLGGRERQLVAEELVLRARLDLDSDHHREAALQARIALEALLAELGGEALIDYREPLAHAANAALDGELNPSDREAVATAVSAMEQAVFRRRVVVGEQHGAG